MYSYTRFSKVKMEDFFKLYQYRILENSSVCPENEICRIWQGPLTKNKKYGLISYKDPSDMKWKKKHAHRLSYIVFTKNLEIISDFDCSHLCHNSLCVNVNHLSMEPHFINNNRQHCLNSNLCYGHVGFGNCLLDLKIF